MNGPGLEAYTALAGQQAMGVLRRMAQRLRGASVLMINSTRHGGGVAEMLHRLVPLMQELGLEVRWEVIEGPAEFYEITKKIHNALQGDKIELTARERELYLQVNAANAQRLDFDADFVLVHDPQPAPLVAFAPRRGHWIWRCHIDASHPRRAVWRLLRDYVSRYDASVFSMAAFSQNLPHPQYLIAPSIDPLSEKNRELDEAFVRKTLSRFGIDPDRPRVVQVSRFDRFKDPLGVIEAFRLVRRRDDAQLILAGGTADDDPEGALVLGQVREAAGDDPDIHILAIPPDSHLEINALQRSATIIVQKSLREGFGLTVTEGLWKRRPVIAGAVGGLTLQVYNHHTGFLVHSVEGLAFRTRYLLNRPRLAEAMGERGHELVRHHYLVTRHLRDWLTLFLAARGDGGVPPDYASAASAAS